MTEPVDESWDWSKASPVMIEVASGRSLPYPDLLPLLEELNKHYTTVRASHTRIEPPAAGPPDIALVLTVIATVAAAEVAKGFFGELGKDAYSGFRRILLDLMKKGRRSDRDRLYVPLAIRIEPWTFFFHGDSEGVLSEEDFLEQLRKAHEYAHAPLDPLPGGSWGSPDEEVVSWHAPSKEWVRIGSPRFRALGGPPSPPPSK
ncbi:MAG: hypothetical protein ACRDJE_12390 [Dehalococcoidia bacterium]